MADRNPPGTEVASEEDVPIESNNGEVGVGELASSLDSNIAAKAIMQASFDKIVSHEFKTPYKYQRVAVLVIRWAEYLDRHKCCDAEVAELKKLFADDFKYQFEELVLDDKKKPQLQLNRGVTNFVFANDGPCRTHLLIVYYTGHGIHSGKLGLDVAGSRQDEHRHVETRMNPQYEPRANWNQAETSLNLAEADVLTVLDTCSAGSAFETTDMMDSSDELKVFEVLAASSRKATTASPGRKSFTRALIDSVKDILRESEGAPFTTHALHQAILRRRSKQNDILFTKFPQRSDRMVKLGPLNTDQTPKMARDAMNCSHLDLRFVFETPRPLSASNTERLTKHLSQAAIISQVGIRNLEWVNFRSQGGQRLAQWFLLCHVVTRWQARVRRSQALKRSRPDENVEDATPAKRSRGTPRSAPSSPSEDLMGPSTPPPS